MRGGINIFSFNKNFLNSIDTIMYLLLLALLDDKQKAGWFKGLTLFGEIFPTEQQLVS